MTELKLILNNVVQSAVIFFKNQPITTCKTVPIITLKTMPEAYSFIKVISYLYLSVRIL